VAPTEAPTPLVVPKSNQQRNNTIYGVLIVVLVGMIFLGTSWYADRQSRRSRSTDDDDDLGKDLKDFEKESDESDTSESNDGNDLL
jgi:uncharacterized protein HemX